MPDPYRTPLIRQKESQEAFEKLYRRKAQVFNIYEWRVLEESGEPEGSPVLITRLIIEEKSFIELIEGEVARSVVLRKYKTSDFKEVEEEKIFGRYLDAEVAAIQLSGG